MLAKVTTDESIQTFLSLSRTKKTFNNILICIDKTCLNTTSASICPLKVEVKEHSIKVSDFSYLEAQLIRVNIKENVSSEVHLKDATIVISSF